MPVRCCSIDEPSLNRPGKETNGLSDIDFSPARRAFRWCFADRDTGRIVIAQAPNTALLVVLGALGVEVLFKPDGTGGRVVAAAKTASLTYWSFDEILRGANPWRRTLGAVVLVAECVAWLR